MRISVKVLSFFIILVLWTKSYSQLDFLPLNVDYATFAGTNSQTYTEIYLSFYQADLVYQVEDSSKVAHFTHILEITIGDSLIYSTERNYKNAITINEQTKNIGRFMDVFAYQLFPGEYNLKASLVDQVANKQGEYRMPIKVPAYKQELTVSDIELSTQINKSNATTNFSSKNNMEIVPNPSRTYGLTQPILYFYFEAYNLKLNKDDNNRYNYHYYISDADGRRVRDFPEKVKSSNSKTIAEAGGTNIITLAPDSYFLNVEIEDMLTGKKSMGRKKFRVDKPERKNAENIAEARLGGYEEYLHFTRDQLVDEFSKASYIAASQEKKIFEDLDVEGMRRFIAEFWKRRDPDPTTEINEYKRMYFESVQYANATFSSSFKEGWRTDQGRVLLIYGKADEIERHPSAMGTQPYEIWIYYSLEGGSRFIFADLTGHGNFELLHSTYRTEIKDANWEQRIGKVRTEFDSPGFDNY